MIVFRPGKAWAEALSLSAITLAAAAGIGNVVVVTGATTRLKMIESTQPWALALLGAIAAETLKRPAAGSIL